MQNKKYTLKQIAEFLAAELRGDPTYIITSIAPLDKAKAQQLSFFGKATGFAAEMGKFLTTTAAGAVILSPKDAENYSGNVLVVDNPYISYAKLTSWFTSIGAEPGIHSSAVIGKNCQIHESVTIAANCVIGDNVTIDADCYLYPNVTIYHDVKIGQRAIIHGGVVIGADGFGMANDQGVWVKIHQLGSVQVGNDVEVGANTCIDRGALTDTIVEDGVKLDNLIQVGHNVRIGAHTIIAGCTVIAGSTTIGRYCMIGGSVTINGHISIADQSVITGGSVVGRTIEKPGIYSSSLTVQPHRAWLKTILALFKLSDLVARVRKLEEK